MPRTHLIRWIRETAIQLVRLHWEPRLYATLIITTSFVPNIRFPPLSPGCACRPFRTSRCTTVTPSSRIQRSRCTINGGRNGRSNSTTATLSVSMEGAVLLRCTKESSSRRFEGPWSATYQEAMSPTLPRSGVSLVSAVPQACGFDVRLCSMGHTFTLPVRQRTPVHH
jgi:hypothetical protein